MVTTDPTIALQRFRSQGNFSHRVLSPAIQVVIAMTCLLGGVTVTAAEESERPADNPAARARAQVLIESLLKSREKIVSAIVQMRGSQVVKGDDPPPERTMRGMYAFDHAQGAMRFDGSRPTHVRVVQPAAGNDLKAALAQEQEQDAETQFRYVRTQDLCATWCKPTKNSRSSLCLHPPDRGAGGMVAQTHGLIDLRACGILSHFDFSDNGFEKGKGVKEYCEALLKLAVVDVIEKDGKAVVRMRSEFAEHRLTIEVVRQFCPVEYVVSWKKGPGNSSDGSATTRAIWKDAGEVRVPKFMSIEFDWPEEGEYGLYRFSFVWKNVNQPIDKRFFDYRDFPGIPDRTDISDARRKENPTIGFWTEDGIVGPEDESQDGPAGPDPTEPQPDDATNTQTLLAGREAGEERDDTSLGMKFVWCPPGKFTMGGFKGDHRFPGDDRRVEVALTQGFWIGKHEVTQAEWTELKTPAFWQGRPNVKEGDDFPATYVSWENAMAYCRRLTKQERAAGRLPKGWHYTLPTEAQWEYACRAGSTTEFSFDANTEPLENFAWFGNNAGGAGERFAHAVGTKMPNLWGLHDMHGNVSEWCRDGGEDALSGGADLFSAPTDDQRVARGGHFHFPALFCQSAFRLALPTVDRSNMMGDVGVRVVLCPVDNERK